MSEGTSLERPYTVAMLAERWGVSDTFVYDQIACGSLRAFKLGTKLLRVKPEWVRDYEAAMACPAVEPVDQLERPSAASIGRIIRHSRG